MYLNFKKQYPRLYNFYKKELRRCQTKTLNDFSLGLEYFYLYLRMLRDFGILYSPKANVTENQKIMSLCIAVEQYELYQECIYNYYNISSTNVSIKDSSMSSDEVLKAFQKEREQHWSNFWAVVYENIESWVDFDTII